MDEFIKELAITERGRALLSAVKAGLIPEQEGEYDRETVDRFLEEMERNRFHFKLSGAQLNLLLSSKDCAYYSAETLNEQASNKRKNRSGYARYSYFAISALVAFILGALFQLVLKLL